MRCLPLQYKEANHLPLCRSKLTPLKREVFERGKYLSIARERLDILDLIKTIDMYWRLCPHLSALRTFSDLVTIRKFDLLLSNGFLLMWSTVKPFSRLVMHPVRIWCIGTGHLCSRLYLFGFIHVVIGYPFEFVQRCFDSHLKSSSSTIVWCVPSVSGIVFTGSEQPHYTPYVPKGARVFLPITIRSARRFL